MESHNSTEQDKVIQKIKSLRIERNISQSALSDILGISSGQVGNIESSRFQHKYTLKQIAHFCSFIEYPIEQIFLSKEELSNPHYIELLIKRIIEYDE